MSSIAPSPPSGFFYASIFIDLLVVGSVVPFVAKHVEMLDVSPSLIGAVQAVYGGMQLLSTPILGTLSDLYGPRRFLLLSLFGTAVAYGLLAMSLMQKSIGLFLVSRVVIGALRQTMSIGSAMVADCCRSEEGLVTMNTKSSLTKELAHFQSAASAGFVLGPLLGGIAGDALGVARVTAVVAVLEFVNLVLMWSQTRTIGHHRSVADASSETKHEAARSRNPLALALATALREKSSRSRLLTSMYLHSFATVTLQMMLPLVLRKVFSGVTSTHVGLLISLCSGISAAAVMLMPKLIGRTTAVRPHHSSVCSVETKMARVAMTFAFACYVVASVALVRSTTAAVDGASAHQSSSWFFLMFCFALVMHSCANGVSDVLNRSHFTSSFPTTQSGEVLSIVYSLDGFNRVLSPMLGGWLMDYIGAEAPFLCALVAAGAAAVLRLRVSEKASKED